MNEMNSVEEPPDQSQNLQNGILKEVHRVYRGWMFYASLAGLVLSLITLVALNIWLARGGIWTPELLWAGVYAVLPFWLLFLAGIFKDKLMKRFRKTAHSKSEEGTRPQY
jgi:hypothetical protein